MSSAYRVAVLARHLTGGRGDEQQLEARPSAARSSSLSLPPIDAAAMEAALDVDPTKRAMRRQVYSLFENRPDLMPACVEGMRKGEFEVEGGGRGRERERRRKERAELDDVDGGATSVACPRPATISFSLSCDFLSRPRFLLRDTFEAMVRVHSTPKTLSKMEYEMRKACETRLRKCHRSIEKRSPRDLLGGSSKTSLNPDLVFKH